MRLFELQLDGVIHRPVSTIGKRANVPIASLQGTRRRADPISGAERANPSISRFQ